MVLGLFGEVDTVFHAFAVAIRLMILLSITAIDTLRHYVVREVNRSLYGVGRGKPKEGVLQADKCDSPPFSQDACLDADFLSGKTILLTGITHGIGQAALQQFLALPSRALPKRIIFLAKGPATMRGREKEVEGVDNIIHAIESRNIEARCHFVDLASPAQVLAVAKQVATEEAELHLVMSNAGFWSTSPVRCVGCDELEVHFMVNYLATVMLVQTLRPLLDKSAVALGHAPVRVVITGSFTAFDIAGGRARLDDLQLSRRSDLVHFGAGILSVPQAMAYAHSKLLLHMFASHLADKVLDANRIRIVVVDPGIVDTKMHKSLKDFLGPWLGESLYHVAGKWLGCLRCPEEGAAPLVHCCLRRELPLFEGCGSALFCDWGKTYLRQRELSPDMSHFRGSDLLTSWFPNNGRARAFSVLDGAQCEQLYQMTEKIRTRLETVYSTNVKGIAEAQILPARNQECLKPKTMLNSVNSLVEFFYIDFMAPLSEFLPQCPPGPPLIPLRYVINFQKGATLPFCLCLMGYYGNYSQTAWIYSAIHGSYGFCWLLKDKYFRDPKTDELGSLVGISILSMILLLYWYMPFIIISKGIEVPVAQQALCIAMCTIGNVLMMVADCHKHFALEYNRKLAQEKKYLIKDGLFTSNRNPNYLGEMLLYAGFVLMTGPDCKALFIVSSIWVVIFGTNMIKKDISLQKKPGWESYQAQSFLFFFRGR